MYHVRFHRMVVLLFFYCHVPCKVSQDDSLVVFPIVMYDVRFHRMTILLSFLLSCTMLGFTG